MDIIELSEACLNCKKKPCTTGCPLKNNIPGFIKLIKENKLKEGYDVLSKTTLLPEICGLICPKISQCEGKCIKRFSDNTVKIGLLENYLGEYARDNNWKIPSTKKTRHNVLIIGGGPSGLTCAGFLRKNGIGVTIIEKESSLGGLLTYGIPDFRLPKKLVNKTIDSILDLGIKVIYNKELGKDFLIKDVINKYDAIFIGIGSNISNSLLINNENLHGIYGGNEYLEGKIKIDTKDKTIIVCGGGNVSLDVARTLVRKNAKKVIITYRRQESDMRVDLEELELAKKEGIEFLFNTNIINILGDKKIEKVELTKTEIIDNKINNIKNSNYLIKCDYLIRAIGSHTDPEILKQLPIKITNKSKILINKNGNTSNPKIFSGGDVAGCKSTVANASRSGRNAAYQIIRYLKES